MSGPYGEQISDDWDDYVQAWSERPRDGSEAHVAALVAAARKLGRVEGAAKERERITAEIKALENRSAEVYRRQADHMRRPQAYLDGHSDGLAEAVVIVRGAREAAS